jgi:hypothetical protein
VNRVPVWGIHTLYFLSHLPFNFPLPLLCFLSFPFSLKPFLSFFRFLVFSVPPLPFLCLHFFYFLSLVSPFVCFPFFLLIFSSTPLCCCLTHSWSSAPTSLLPFPVFMLFSLFNRSPAILSWIDRSSCSMPCFHHLQSGILDYYRYISPLKNCSIAHPRSELFLLSYLIETLRLSWFWSCLSLARYTWTILARCGWNCKQKCWTLTVIILLIIWWPSRSLKGIAELLTQVDLIPLTRLPECKYSRCPGFALRFS